MVNDKKMTGSQALTQLLTEFNQEGGFSISALTDQHGFPLASAKSANVDHDVQSTVVAMVQKMSTQAVRQLGMAKMSEIILNDALGQCLVCRSFQIKERDLILAFSLADKDQNYKRVTNQAIRNIW